jgi:hypothetical protein
MTTEALSRSAMIARKTNNVLPDEGAPFDRVWRRKRTTSVGRGILGFYSLPSVRI